MIKLSRKEIKNKIQKKKGLSILVSLLVTAFFALIAYGAYGTGIYISTGRIELDDISNVAIDRTENTYVLNNGGYQLLRINNDGDINLVISALGADSNTFERAVHVAVDDDGNIYVHNRMASEEALSWIGSENIIKFNKNGGYVDTYCNIEYDEPQLRTGIIALQNVDGEIFDFIVSEQGLQLVNVENGDTALFAYPDADVMINAAAYSDDEECIYATTRDGKIIRLNSNSYDTIYATADNDTEEGSFEDIAIDDEGNIYVCDVRKGSVDMLEDGELTEIFEPNSIIYDMDYNGSFAFNEIYSVVTKSDDNYYSLNETSLSGWAFYRSVIFIIAQILIFVPLTYPLYLAIVAIIRSKSNKVKIMAGLCCVVLILTSVFCLLVSQEYSSMLGSQILDDVISKAQMLGNLIDTDDFKSLDSVTDFGSDSYNNIKKIVNNIFLDDGRLPGDSYVIMYTLEDDGSVIERYSLEETVGCNYQYVWTDGTDEQYIYETGDIVTSGEVSDSEGSFIAALCPITDENGQVIGLIETGVDKTIFQKSIQRKIFHFAISIIAIAVVFILLILELLEFFEAKKGTDRKALGTGMAMPPLKLYRAVVFSVAFITNITTPFMSIYALSLSDRYCQLSGMSAEILAAVPISAEVLFGAIFSMTGGSIIKHLGSRKSGLLGSAMFTLGLILRFIYPDLILLTLGNAMQGSGWGIVLLIVNSRIAAEEDETVSEQGFTDYNIAMQNGINSGIVLGGFLLAFVNYTAMLVIAAILSVVVLVFSYYFIFDSKRDKAENEVDGKSSGGILSYFRFVFSPRVLVYFLFIVVPVIAASYYLNFMYPILGDRLGLSESLIGYSYLLNGLVIIGFGNLIVNVMSKYFDRKLLLMISSIMYFVIFAMVGLMDSVPTLLISLILLAVADSFGYVAQNTFYTELKETEAFGYEKAMGVYSLFENLSQSAGSFIFGYILTVGVKVGMTVYGAVIGALGIIFVLVIVLCDKHNKRKGNINE